MDLQTKFLYIILYSYWGYFYGQIITNTYGIGLPVDPFVTGVPLYYESIPGEDETIANYSVWNFKNIKRTQTLTGNYSFTEDMDNTFLRGMECYYSPKGSSRYQKLPFRLPLVPMCEYYNTSYRQYVERHFIGKTNFPTLPPEGICPIPKGNYWVKDVNFKDIKFPSTVPRGLYRLEERFYKTKPKRKMVGGVNLYGRVYSSQE